MMLPIQQVVIYLLIAAPTALCFAAGGPSSGGGPPPGVVAGPPEGAGGPPPGVVGGGGPPSKVGGANNAGGGPPPGTAAPGGLETFFEKAWPILYAFDLEGKLRDSSKNLRVLWTRALLASLGKIDDPIAYELLPRFTRRIVGPLAASSIWSGPMGAPAVSKLDWIVDRTNFIDKTLKDFLEEETPGNKQVIVLGAGYDTRSIRFQSPDIKFFEVDLPDIANAKESIMTAYSGENNKNIIRPTHLGFDLNTIATQQTSLIDDLVEKKGLSLEEPTMIICEAVLFYLMPEAAQGLVKELFSLNNAGRYCFTDNLAKLGVSPGPPVPTPKEKCQGWLEREGKTLMDHNAIWGGAIHFVDAK